MGFRWTIVHECNLSCVPQKHQKFVETLNYHPSREQNLANAPQDGVQCSSLKDMGPCKLRQAATAAVEKEKANKALQNKK